MVDRVLSDATADSPASAPRLKGSDRYEIIRCLGQGGMGVVHEAYDKQRRERIALKTLRQFDASALYRFKQEFRTLADVLHPNLVHLHELVASEKDDVFFTMELVEGSDFLDYVQQPGAPRSAIESAVVERDRSASHGDPDRSSPTEQGQLPPSPVADFGRLRSAMCQLVEGVAALHAAGKLHRDLKPSNVRVTSDGRVVVLDFGVATELGNRRSSEDPEDDQIVGTVAYMAPEQGSGEQPVPASDWYSVGVILYEALVGAPPHVGSTVDVLTWKCTVDPVAPLDRARGIPGELSSLCMDLLAVDPGDRPSAAQILRRLGRTTSDRAPPVRLSDAPSAVDLFGRDPQLGLLREAFETARERSAVWVRVAGMAGMGKSSVAHHFLDDLERRGGVLILRGRAYERESVPYKAVDTLIDALSRHLMEREQRREAIELPAGVGTLAQVFPVLRRVRSIADFEETSAEDPRSVRQRAFTALRELFGALSRATPIVVFIDDVQWGDVDSAALLLQLLRPPGEPRLLLLTTHRVESAETSPFLAELLARWPEDSDARDVEVGPLEPDEAHRLALAVLGARDASAQRAAEAIARESGGNPFLLEELARTVSGYHRIGMSGQPAAPLTLEQMIGERVARLPDPARRLLEVVAVSGRPLPLATVRDASGLPETAPQLVALLRARRFVRTGLRDGLETVEASHDRIRETVVALLSPEVTREHHSRLARVLELTGDSDPEAIATHLLGAGDRDRAGLFAERAAEQAIAKLAFAQAARLFQLRIDTADPAAPELHRLRLRMAQASEWAGHAEKAARAYLAAAEEAPPLERLDLRRAAAGQLIAAGRIDEGAATFRGVLAAVGRSVPTTGLGILFWAIFYRITYALLLRSKLRAERELDRQERLRLDALQAAQRAMTLVDPTSGLYVKARYLVDALRSGNRFYLVRAAAAEAGTLASAGGPESRREQTLFAMAERLARESSDVEGLGLYEMTYGVSQYLRGRWASAIELLDRAYVRLVALRRWQANASVYRTYALTSMGDLPEVKSRTKTLLADAQQRGDLYTAVNLRASRPMTAWLAADDVEGVRRHLRDAFARWPQNRFLVQHWQYMLMEAEVHLYAGEGREAWERLVRDQRRLRRSLLLRVQLIRAWTHFVRGRSAVASLEHLDGQQRAARLLAAARIQEQLEREGLPWTDALAAMLMASLASISGDEVGAATALRRAIELSESAEMALHAAASRYFLGLLLRGKEGAGGAELISSAEDAMKSRGVRLPARFAAMFLPGRWPAAPEGLADSGP